MEAEACKKLMAERFRAEFGQLPTVWVQTPGRVDLMGSHTDYNEGFVLTQAINRNTWIATAPRSDGRIRVCPLNLDGCSEFGLDGIDRDTVVPWANYVRGVADVL